jgi:hypothetical protein
VSTHLGLLDKAHDLLVQVCNAVIQCRRGGFDRRRSGITGLPQQVLPNSAKQLFAQHNSNVGSHGIAEHLQCLALPVDFSPQLGLCRCTCKHMFR